MHIYQASYSNNEKKLNVVQMCKKINGKKGRKADVCIRLYKNSQICQYDKEIYMKEYYITHSHILPYHVVLCE